MGEEISHASEQHGNTQQAGQEQQRDRLMEEFIFSVLSIEFNLIIHTLTHTSSIASFPGLPTIQFLIT